MIVKKLKLRNYRNYKALEIEPGPGMNLITGHNAQGKTNLLESLVYISLTRSHRIHDDKKLIRNGSEFAQITCIYDDGVQRQLDAVIHHKGKTLMAYRQPVKRSSDFIGKLNVVLFSPDDLTIFTDSPADRRRLMNQEIAKVSPRYLQALNQYNRLLKNRNLLLKRDHPNQTLLDTMDEQMSQAESIIIQSRYEFVNQMNLQLTKMYQILSKDTINVTMTYQCYCKLPITQENILQTRRDARQNDLLHHSTTVGIHREDLVFQMNDTILYHVASQGQKRMTVLAFKLALMQYIEQKTGQKPVLLLDDVLSELDLQRQNQLLQMIQEPYQCFITATEVPILMKNIKMNHFVIENGQLIKTGGLQ